MSERGDKILIIHFYDCPETYSPESNLLSLWPNILNCGRKNSVIYISETETEKLFWSSETNFSIQL